MLGLPLGAFNCKVHQLSFIGGIQTDINSKEYEKPLYGGYNEGKWIYFLMSKAIRDSNEEHIRLWAPFFVLINYGLYGQEQLGWNLNA